jgi:hypothetical protein
VKVFYEKNKYLLFIYPQVVGEVLLDLDMRKFRNEKQVCSVIRQTYNNFELNLPSEIKNQCLLSPQIERCGSVSADPDLAVLFIKLKEHTAGKS